MSRLVIPRSFVGAGRRGTRRRDCGSLGRRPGTALGMTVPAVAVALLAAACASGPPPPAPLDTRHEACAHCRMAVSDARFASQVVAPRELAAFFDDLGCLAAWLKEGRAPAGAVAYVADHRTKQWVRADRAVYARSEEVETPMGSHVIAHADAGSRDQDPDARGGSPVSAPELFGPGGPPTGAQR